MRIGICFHPRNMHVIYRVSAQQCPAQSHFSRGPCVGCNRDQTCDPICVTVPALAAIFVFILNTSHYHRQHHHRPSVVLANGLFAFPHIVNIPQHSGILRSGGSRGNGTLRRFHHVTVVTVDTKYRIIRNRLFGLIILEK